MRDEDIRQAEFLLEILHQIHDLRLNRDVEGADRLVGDHDLRVGGERARDADALALSAGKLVRIAMDVSGDRPTFSISQMTRSLRSAAICVV